MLSNQALLDKNKNFRASKSLRSITLLSADLVVFLIAWIFAVSVAATFSKADWGQWFPPNSVAGTIYTIMSLLVLCALAISGQYQRRSAFWEETRIVWRYSLLVGLVNFALNFILQVTFNRTVLVLTWSTVLILLPWGRLAAREFLLRRKHWIRKALLVGGGINAQEALSAIHRERHMGLLCAGIVLLDKQIPVIAPQLQYIPTFNAAVDLNMLAHSLGCEVIVVALDDKTQVQATKLLALLNSRKFEIFVVPQLQGLPVHSMQAQHFFSNDILFLELRQKLFSPAAQWIKRAVDIVVSLLLMAVLSPVMLWALVRIFFQDGFPVIYRQKRVGAQGEEFEFLKFRSMVKNADAMLESWRVTHPDLYAQFQKNFKLAQDPRLLSCGAFLRRSSIDELPQLWNVLRGEMSLVGPRPFPRRELERFPLEAIDFYNQVKPGITGLWQVSGRSDASFEQRLALNIWYVRNWSLWVDWVILLKTVRVVFSGRGAV